MRLAWILGACALVPLLGAPAFAGSPLHPEFALLDEAGEPVLASGRPVSPMKTCGECHDTEYIAGHSYHASVGADERISPEERSVRRPWSFSPGLFGRWSPMRYERLTVPGEAAFDLGVADWIRIFGERHVGGGPAFFDREGRPLEARTAGTDVDPETHVRDEATGRPVPWDWTASGGVEMNCFLCHIPDPADDARMEVLRAGKFRWAATATLANTGLIERGEDGGWSWRRDAFGDDGTVAREVIRIGDPAPHNCGLCHGSVVGREGAVRFRRGLKNWETESKGQIWSPQRVADSLLNLESKAQRTYAWDVHAEHLVGCVDCHHSINNPSAFAEATRSRPRHLRYDARRLSLGEYLEKPSHHFAKGESAQGNVARRLDGSMRRCEDCHDAYETHQAWLPNPRRHLSILLCETCHTPTIPSPAHESCDWTVLTPEGRPNVAYRGIDGDIDDPRSLVRGYEPVVIPRTSREGHVRHGPHNLCTGWFWIAGDPPRPVPLGTLKRAYFGDGDAYLPEIVRVLDQDGDGKVAASELRLDTAAKVEAVRERLATVGVEGARIEGCIQPMSLHHNVLPGAFATRRCEACHASDSRLTRPFELSPYVPAGATAQLVGDSNVVLAGEVRVADDGRLLFEPQPTEAGRYLIGHDRAGWIDILGILLIVGTIVGVGFHASARVVANRIRGKEAR